MLDILKAALFGIIQGITEWLPISSTGHMILAEELIMLKDKVRPEFWEMFLVVIQLGSILAVILLFFNKLNPLSAKKTAVQRGETLKLWGKVLVACLPAGIIGILFNDKIDAVFYNSVTVATTLILYGIFFIILENRNRSATPAIQDFEKLSWKNAVLIGVFQLLALIPGTSRSGATILGAMLLGASREISAEFSFFLAIPVMFGASALKLLKFVNKFGLNFTGTEASILSVGTIVAFIVSIAAIKFLMNFIKKHDFKPFGWYRIVLGLVVMVSGIIWIK